MYQAVPSLTILPGNPRAFNQNSYPRGRDSNCTIPCTMGLSLHYGSPLHHGFLSCTMDRCHCHMIISCIMTSQEVTSFFTRKIRGFLDNKNPVVQIQGVTTCHHGHHSHLHFHLHGPPPMSRDHSLRHDVTESDIILHKKNYGVS